ncbi:MAG: putative transporter permease protein [Herbaspirillum sp.]|nr:putative transporter permease protein [Herbaspirillum sp.]
MRVALSCLSMLGLVVAWEITVRWFSIPEWILPAPSSIAQVALEWRVDLMHHSWVTLYETLAGFMAALAIALPIAIVIAYTPILKHTIYPALLALQSVPKVAIAPLITLWVGFGAMPKIIVVFLVCFFPIVVSAAAGLEATSKSRLDLMRSLKAKPWQVFWRLRIPEAMPHIMVGCKVGITFAVIGAVIGEFVGSEEGLGFLILTSTAQSKTSLAFSALIILTVISIALYYLVEQAEKMLVVWKSQ